MTTRRAVLAGAAALLAAGSTASGVATVTCAAGSFTGTREGVVSAFRGIRYGRAARFCAPLAEPRANAPVAADAFGPACPQRSRRQPQAEDCLHLNIWTTEPDPRARRPVLVWIHGGAYAFGSASDPIADGARLAGRGDLVVVSVNHRLNLFGYLYLGGLDPRFKDSGNLGQLDLILALRWVHANIAAFGGDPTRVTLVGQSGGGAKIATLLAMPAARGLFAGAITMSGQQVTVTASDRATARARAVLARLGLRAPVDLTEMPAPRLVEAIDTPDPFVIDPVYTGPVLDGRWLTRHPFDPDAHPAGLGVALMLGGTRDETRDFSDPLSPAMVQLGWEALAGRLAAELPVAIAADRVVAAYRRRMPAASPAEIFYAATSDGRSWRPQLIEAEARARAGRPAWMYQVDFASPIRPERGAFHGIDIALLFGTLDAADAWTGRGPVTCALSRTMQDRFTAFATSGTPEVAGLTRWPTYTLPTRATMIFDDHSRVVNAPRDWQRALFARAAYTQPGT